MVGESELKLKLELDASLDSLNKLSLKDEISIRDVEKISMNYEDLLLTAELSCYDVSKYINKKKIIDERLNAKLQIEYT